MAIANLKLIAAMRKTADDLEQEPRIYIWSMAWRCNCGLLAQRVMGLTPASMKDQWVDEYSSNFLKSGTWSSNLTCDVTRLPVGTILRTLSDAGLDPIDLADLESLRCPAVLHRAGIINKKSTYYARPRNVIRYLRAWADMLEEQLSPEPEAVEEEAGELELVGV